MRMPKSFRIQPERHVLAQHVIERLVVPGERPGPRLTSSIRNEVRHATMPFRANEETARFRFTASQLLHSQFVRGFGHEQNWAPLRKLFDSLFYLIAAHQIAQLLSSQFHFHGSS